MNKQIRYQMKSKGFLNKFSLRCIFHSSMGFISISIMGTHLMTNLNFIKPKIVSFFWGWIGTLNICFVLLICRIANRDNVYSLYSLTALACSLTRVLSEKCLFNINRKCPPCYHNYTYIACTWKTQAGSLDCSDSTPSVVLNFRV